MILSSVQLNEMMADRDWRIRRTTLATQAKKYFEQTGKLQLPNELKITGLPEVDSALYNTYINGFIMENSDGRVVCSYDLQIKVKR